MVRFIVCSLCKEADCLSVLRRASLPPGGLYVTYYTRKALEYLHFLWKRRDFSDSVPAFHSRAADDTVLSARSRPSAIMDAVSNAAAPRRSSAQSFAPCSCRTAHAGCAACDLNVRAELSKLRHVQKAPLKNGLETSLPPAAFKTAAIKAPVRRSESRDTAR